MGESYHCHLSRLMGDFAVFPSLWGKEGFLRQIVCFPFMVVGSVELQVVDKRRAIFVQMEHGMSQFVHQDPPKVVDPVIAKGESDHRAAISRLHGGSVQVCLRQVRDDLDGNALLVQELHSAFEPVRRRALLGHGNHQLLRPVR